MPHYAHTASHPDGTIDSDRTRWQPLENHLLAVAEHARALASRFGADEVARFLGAWHDIGKYRPEFQSMLDHAADGKAVERVDHSTPGALFSTLAMHGAILPRHQHALIDLLSRPIAAHHSGLADTADLQRRFSDKQHLLHELVTALPTDHMPGTGWPPPSLPKLLLANLNDDASLAVEMLCRMLLSVLVDADRSDAADFDAQLRVPVGRSAAPQRTTMPSSMADLCGRLDRHLEQLVDAADNRLGTDSSRDLFRYRQEVLESCRYAANLAPGPFNLDVATGGGKTLSALAFALRHAQIHGLERVIVVIPFTSIIEQTARIYCEALGEHNVLEHHSAIDESTAVWTQRARTDGAVDSRWSQYERATEDWDVPVIVTTSVQFFESLLANRPSRLRKIHRVARSVVIIDEVQTLPTHLIEPTYDVMRELGRAYSCSIVLSTATQPTGSSHEAQAGTRQLLPTLPGTRSIVPANVLRPPPRVTVEWPAEQFESWQLLAKRIAGERQALVITHRRADARDLCLAADTAAGDQSTIHLSTLMCPTHRGAVLEDIRHRLASGAPCRVVSTQLIEAGVDVDFPVVYRAMAGLDSLAQAAGRANREGRLGVEGGRLVVFSGPTTPPVPLRRPAAVAEGLVREGDVDLFDPMLYRRYFTRFWTELGSKLDNRQIMAERRKLNFATVADRYRFIDDDGTPIVIPYDDGARSAIAQLGAFGATRALFRKLGRYSVSVHHDHFESLIEHEVLDNVLPLGDGTRERDVELWVLRQARMSSYYSDRFGLLHPEPIGPADLWV